MNFAEFLDHAARHLDAAGIAYSKELDPWLETQWRKRVPLHKIVGAYRDEHGHG